MHKYSNKSLPLTFSALLLLNIMVLTVTSASVQAVSKPSVPQFNVKFIDNSYPGYLGNIMRIDVTIKNQHFTPYTDDLGREYVLYYRVEVKGHFEGNIWNSFVSQRYNNFIDKVSFVIPSDSEYTVVSSETLHDANAQLDFRVGAFIGYWVEPSMGDHLGGFHDLRLVEAESSGWSDIQTITITFGGSSLSPSQTATPTQNITATPDNNVPQRNFRWSHLIVIIVTVCIIMIPIAVVAYINRVCKVESFLKHHEKTT